MSDTDEVYQLCPRDFLIHVWDSLLAYRQIAAMEARAKNGTKVIAPDLFEQILKEVEVYARSLPSEGSTKERVASI